MKNNIFDYLGAVVGQANVSPEMAALLSALASGVAGQDLAVDDLTLTGSLAAPNFTVTREGGVAFKLTNKTGEASVKGAAVNFHPTVDNAFVAATEAFTVQGFVYESGIADGDECWVVRDGVADFLLVDGYACAPNSWVRLSPTVAGRCITQTAPGLDFPPASVAYDSANGSTVSGSVSDLFLDNGVKLVIGGTTGAPSIDARFTFTGITTTPNELVANGYFGANRAAGVTLSVWDFVAAGGSWVLVDTFPASGTQDITITSSSITADMVSSGEMRVRLHGADGGTTAERFFLDKLIFRSTAENEHFKEIGHGMITAAAGTNVLGRLNIHFL